MPQFPVICMGVLRTGEKSLVAVSKTEEFVTKQGITKLWKMHGGKLCTGFIFPVVAVLCYDCQAYWGFFSS